MAVGVAMALALQPPVSAQQRTDEGAFFPQVDADAMVIDALLLRPLGLAGTAIGTVAFVVTLPISLLAGNAGEAADKMVVEPFEYTFTRPLGRRSRQDVPPSQ
jgi:hypothetical protein